MKVSSRNYLQCHGDRGSSAGDHQNDRAHMDTSTSEAPMSCPEVTSCSFLLSPASARPDGENTCLATSPALVPENTVSCYSSF